jgi:hypothetical protein
VLFRSFPEFTDITLEIFKKKFDIELEAVDDEEES